MTTNRPTARETAVFKLFEQELASQHATETCAVAGLTDVVAGTDADSAVRILARLNLLRALCPEPVPTRFDTASAEHDLRCWFEELRGRQTLGWAAAELMRRRGVSARRLARLTGAHRATVDARLRSANGLANAIETALEVAGVWAD